MRVCSVCLKCYDDSDAICNVDEGHGSLARSRKGNCLQVEGYRIDSRFGSDSPVELYKATHTATKKRVLIQFIAPGGSVSETETRLLAAAELDHQNLLRILDFGKLSKRELFAVLEDVSGRSLLEYLEESAPVPEKQAIEIARQIAEGLEALHSNGMVHGAVNPANVFFISDAGNSPVKLGTCDYGGASRPFDGSSLYFSPEKMAGQTIDFRSDLYSLALVFYEMLIGRLPYDPSDDEPQSGFVFDNLDVWHLHVDLRALIAHSLGESLKRRPELRPKSTDIYVRQLRHLEQVAAHAMRDRLASNSERVEDSVPEITASAQQRIVPELSVSRVSDAPVSKSKAEPQISLGSIDLEESGEAEPVRTISELSAGEAPGFVEVPIGRGMPAEPVRFEAAKPAPVRIRSRSLIYIAGLLVSAVLGGVFASTFFDAQNSAATVTSTKSVEKKAGVKQTRTPGTSPAVIPAPENDDIFELARDLDQVVDVADADSFKKTVRKSRALRSTGARTLKKQNRRYKRKPRRTKQSTKEQELPTRPRYVKDVIIYY